MEGRIGSVVGKSENEINRLHFHSGYACRFNIGFNVLEIQPVFALLHCRFILTLSMSLA